MIWIPEISLKEARRVAVPSKTGDSPVDRLIRNFGCLRMIPQMNVD